MAEGDLTGSLAVVTGGGSGIGQGVCRMFSQEGCTVVVADINHTAAEETVKQLKGTGHSAIPVNVTDKASVAELFSKIRIHYSRVPDVVVNCAGIIRKNLFLDQTEEDFENQFNVNMKGTFLVSQEGCKQMIEHKVKAGSVINISSGAADKAVKKGSLYSATKGAVESFTRTVALEMAPHGIRVNVIRPGYVDTPMVQTYFKKHPEELAKVLQNIPQGRFAEPSQMAAVCTFLASKKSSYMTGAVVPVSGGFGL